MRAGSATGGTARLRTSSGRGSSWSTSISTSCPRSSTATGSRRRAAAPSPSSVAPTISEIRGARSPRRSASWSPRSSGARPEGPIRLLTNLRYFGHCFNPVSLYYCFDAPGIRVETIVAEVTNTPWGERHAYVLTPAAARPAASIMCGRFAKEFHVSPFMGMNLTYAWRMTEPGNRLIVHIESEREQAVAFDATLSLERGPLSPARLRRLLAGHPLLTLRIVRQIYANGLRLRLKGARYFPNPSGAPLLGRTRREHARASRERVVPR